MTDQSPVVDAPIDNNQANIAENTNLNVEQTTKQEISAENTETKTEKKRIEIDPEVLAELKTHMENKQPIIAKVEDRVRGGLKLNYKGVALFLPISHYDIKPNPTEEELIRLVGDVVEVQVLEVNDDVPSHRRNIIVSRKMVLENKFWEQIKVGDIVSGPISSITTFGIFVDVGGVEGLIHTSRLTRKGKANPKDFGKKGDILTAKVVEVDKERKRIGLSLAELEPNVWDNINEHFPVGSTTTVKVKRFVDFGAFVELKNGVQGLIRNTELSWTKRVNHPEEILKIDQEIEAQVISINPEKELINLSYRATQPNPWAEIENNFKPGTEYVATIKQIKPLGAVVEITENLDGFMPRSKMKPLMKGNKIPFKKGDKIDVIISEVVAQQQSIILEPKVNEEIVDTKPRREKETKDKKVKQIKEETQIAQPIETTSTEVGSFSMSEMLGDDILSKLLGR